MRFTIETWLGLSVLLNLVLISWMLGAWRGRRIARPLEDLTIDLKIASAELERRSDEILAEYGTGDLEKPPR